MSSILETPVSISIAIDENIDENTAIFYLKTALAVSRRYQKLSPHMKFRDITVSRDFDRVTMTATAGLVDHRCHLIDGEDIVAAILVPLTDTIVINGVTWVPRYPDYEYGALVYSAENNKEDS